MWRHRSINRHMFGWYMSGRLGLEPGCVSRRTRMSLTVNWNWYFTKILHRVFHMPDFWSPQKICTCHDSSAVVVCTKFRSGSGPIQRSLSNCQLILGFPKSRYHKCLFNTFLLATIWNHISTKISKNICYFIFCKEFSKYIDRYHKCWTRNNIIVFRVSFSSNKFTRCGDMFRLNHTHPRFMPVTAVYKWRISNKWHKYQADF